MQTTPRLTAWSGAVALCLSVALTGCSSGSTAAVRTDPVTAARSSSSTPAAPTATAAPTAQAAPHLPGYPDGSFPPVPLFTLPDLGMLDTSLAGFSIKVDKAVGSYPGLSVSPARCDVAGTVQAGPGALQLYGDGSGNYDGPDGDVHNYGDGSGSFSLNGSTVNVYGDGSGSYSKGDVLINSYGDGSGRYADGKVTINLYSDGSGTYNRGPLIISNYGDGSGKYTDGAVSISNYGDGSGTYTDGAVSISNYGDGSGTYTDADGTVTYGDGTGRRMGPIAKVPVLGKFPKMGAIRPITSCGTVISLRDDVLFDFDKSTIRPGASAVLASLARALQDLKVSAATIGGHTDSISTETYNLALSGRRAAAVVKALTGKSVTARLVATGYGETRPVAPNTVDGKDNPAGRQLNRRVEIFIPAASAGS